MTAKGWFILSVIYAYVGLHDSGTSSAKRKPLNALECWEWMGRECLMMRKAQKTEILVSLLNPQSSWGAWGTWEFEDGIINHPCFIDKKILAPRKHRFGKCICSSVPEKCLCARSLTFLSLFLHVWNGHVRLYLVIHWEDSISLHALNI